MLCLPSQGKRFFVDDQRNVLLPYMGRFPAKDPDEILVSAEFVVSPCVSRTVENGEEKGRAVRTPRYESRRSC